MKKRLLFMLTVVMIMCAVMFSASATDCNNLENPISHHYVKKEVVKATCITDGYDIYRCTNGDCKSYYTTNPVEKLGHSWSANVSYESRESGKYYWKHQTCTRTGCGKNEVEKEGNTEVKYYKIEFFNGQAFKDRDTSVTVNSYSKTYEVPVTYTVLATVPVENTATNTFSGTKVDPLMENCYVKEGNSITYNGKKPIRTKDMRYGEFRFVGWTKNHNYDLVPAAVTKDENAFIGSTLNYNVTVSNVHANAKYYAAWEGVEVSYKTIVYNSDGQQLLIAQNVKHGDSIDYPFSYPTRESATSVDYIFDGWEIGTKTAAKDQYDFYSKDGAHIKHIPIFSGDAIMAHHATTPRIYTIEFCDKNWNVMSKAEIGYNSSVSDDTVGFNYKNFTDVTGTYAYEYRGYWETEKGNKVYLENFTVPAGSVDYNDPLYLKDSIGNYFKDNAGKNLEVTKLHECLNSNYFNSNVVTYLFVVNEKGETIVNAGGKALTLLVYKDNKTDKMVVNELDANGNRVKFDEADAENIRSIKIRPAYYQRIIDREIIIETSIPSSENIPEDYKNGLVVQITNENGQLIASGVTSNHRCVLTVPKAEMYNITVVSTNGKYYAEKGIVWSVFEAMYKNKENIKMDLSLDKDYNESTQARCRCICHNSILRGLWVRILNVLYRLFGTKYVCCYDMYVTIGDLLAYTK